MKLLYAGQGVSAKSYTQLQYNCTRNKACQRLYYVPVNQFSDVVFFADLVGKPDTYQIDVYNVCDIAHIGSAVANDYVIGTTPSGSWYGVFGSFIVTPPMGVVYDKFFFKFTFTIGALSYVYYSEQFEFPWCDNLTPLRGCYPNETVGSDAFDCNGIYYGFPNNEDFLGNGVYRYFHTAFLRLASIIEQKNSFVFTAFNSRRIYKSEFTRQYLFESDIVPTFFKDVLIGIYNRGNVQINGNEWKLADQQDVSMIDTDSKLWRLDILLDSLCKQNFGCKPADCALPVPSCEGNPTGLTYELVGENWIFTFDDGTIVPGDSIDWEIRDLETNDIIISGSITEEPLQFSVPTVTLSLADTCYIAKWRKLCVDETVSAFTTMTIGTCELSPCEEQGFIINGGDPPVYACLFFSPDEVDFTHSELCSGINYSVPGTGWIVWVGFYSDPDCLIPQSVTLINFPITIPATTYTLNGTGFAFELGAYPQSVYELNPEFCTLEGPFDQSLPFMDPSDCWDYPEPGTTVDPGIITLNRAGEAELEFGVCVEVLNGACGPSLAMGDDTAAQGLNPYYGKVKCCMAGAAGIYTGTVTVTDTINTEVINGPFVVTPSCDFFETTGNFYLDGNHPMTVTFDIAP